MDAIVNSSNSKLDLNRGNIISVKVKIKLLFIPDFFTLCIVTELYKQRLSARSKEKNNKLVDALVDLWALLIKDNNC